MITRVQLTNWKAYDHLDLELTSGTTFLVAPNGVGKSSFLEAVKWALDPNAAPSEAFMRRLAATTTVIVDLCVRETDVIISHTLTRGSGATPSLTSNATVGGEDKPISDALKWIASSWKADPDFLHRSAFLTDRLLLESGEPNLEDHLVRLYSLDALRQAQTAAKAAAATFEAQGKAAKKQTKVSAADLSAAEQHVEELDSAATVATEDATTANDAATVAVTATQAVILAREQYERWESTYAALVTDVEGLLGELNPDTSLDDLLQSAEAGARAQFVRDTERRAALTERVSSVDASLARLHSAEGDCPVCRRPLDADSREHAEAAHQADREAATGELANLDPAGADGVASDIGRLRRRLQDLGQRPVLPDETDPDLAALQEVAEVARVAAAAAGTAAEQARVVAGVARQRVADLKASNAAPDPTLLFEQAGLLTACAEALDDGIAQVLERQIGPLSDQVNRRWEALFPDRAGLTLDRKGKLARVYDDEGGPLPFESFSSGEKVIAKILMRLTTLSATTEIPFIWIDEPLEHLDPNSRVFVAETLALLTSTDGITQIVVTTYEDELARRLEAQEDHPVRLRVLRNTAAFN